MTDEPRDAWLRPLIEQWRSDPGGTYRTWFLWEERLKNFRAIRRGIAAVVAEIETDRFGHGYKGSSLETVVGSIAEQRQIFKGADHAFLWKPKLRIPDIYENRENQQAFGRFLNACHGCQHEAPVLAAIHRLDQQRVKGLGPAAANMLYFLHPTIVPPFNTAIVRGYNRVTGARVKLGRWDEYLAMRAGMLALNARFRGLLSNDLGALAGFLFDVGSDRYPLPTDATEPGALACWEADLARVRAEGQAATKAQTQAIEADATHTQVQGWLRDLGLALGFRVWIASNDRGRAYGAGRLGDGCLDVLPACILAPGAEDTIRLIDVLWLAADRDAVPAAFEVEHSTSIYSGIVRMLDLALGLPDHLAGAYFLVAPQERETAVHAQFRRPAFGRVSELDLRYLSYEALAAHREPMARFGSGLKPVHAIATSLRGAAPAA